MKITLDPEFYSLEAVADMTQQFSDFMRVESVVGEEMLLIMNVKQEYDEERSQIINAFLNNILELSIQDIMNNER
ncbi:hypothetical protein RYZ59_08200 [Citrobacter sp. HN-141]|uniref:hypothetical protein n=1 Tax=unclassified Citrobacter TaxID=2644389 RepID=UPI0010C96581|nr:MULTISPECIES: hypothetical protein [unclassified Citrobacter]MDW2643564.1 hypothetical protein [Citrobacter sp. HN-141]MDW2652911.1 hypothetical protein [Citrobacter sp. HN-120]MDW2695936.1 hypothetical protein [Citrobacter sp. HN-144]TKV14180.1 hypothetical protein FDX19_01175 [Citrobacter sp. wls619]